MTDTEPRPTNREAYKGSFEKLRYPSAGLLHRLRFNRADSGVLNRIKSPDSCGDQDCLDRKLAIDIAGQSQKHFLDSIR